MEPLQKKVKEAKEAKPSRPVFIFTVPEKLADGIQSIGMVQLEAREEMLAAKRSGVDPIRLVYEQVKQSLVEVNGEPVSLADGTVDRAFDTMNPQIRGLIMSAFTRLHTPPEDVLEGFLGSQSVRVA